MEINKEIYTLMDKAANSYVNKGASVSDREWMEVFFKKELPDYNDEEIIKMVDEIIQALGEQEKLRESVDEYCQASGPKEHWLYKQIKAQLQAFKMRNNKGPGDDDAQNDNEADEDDSSLDKTNLCKVGAGGALGAGAVFFDDNDSGIDNAYNDGGINLEFGEGDELSSWDEFVDLDFDTDITEKVGFCSGSAMITAVGLVVAKSIVNKSNVTPHKLMVQVVTAGSDSGAKTVLSSVLKVSAEKKLIPNLIRGTMLNSLLLASIACLSIELIKVTYMIYTDKLSITEGVDFLARATCCNTGALIGNFGVGVALSSATLISPLLGISLAITATLVGSTLAEKLYLRAKEIRIKSGLYRLKYAQKVMVAKERELLNCCMGYDLGKA